MAIVSPLPEDVEAHAKILLEEADSVHDVQTTMDGPHGVAFHVPDDLAERFLARIHAVVDEVVDDVKKVKRGRQAGSKNKATESSEGKE